MKISNLAKKLLGVAVAGGIVAAMLVPATGVLAASDTTVTVGGPTTVNPGQTFTVPITIGTTLQIRGWQFEVTYDPTVLTYNPLRLRVASFQPMLARVIITSIPVPRLPARLMPFVAPRPVVLPVALLALAPWSTFPSPLKLELQSAALR